MKSFDILMAVLPILVFLVHVVWGNKLKIFAYGDGLNIGLLILAAIIYATGLLLLPVARPVAYMILVASFSFRPLLYWAGEHWARSYKRKHICHPKRKHM